VRRAVRDFDPKMGVWNARTMDDHRAGPLAQPRLCTLLLSSFGLAALLFEVSPTDPATLDGISILRLTVALIAACLPARRATRGDPVQALRAE
jgi:hypothetical protein